MPGDPLIRIFNDFTEHRLDRTVERRMNIRKKDFRFLAEVLFLFMHGTDDPTELLTESGGNLVK